MGQLELSERIRRSICELISSQDLTPLGQFSGNGLKFRCLNHWKDNSFLFIQPVQRADDIQLIGIGDVSIDRGCFHIAMP